jgi:phenolic acid decarboxylase
MTEVEGDFDFVVVKPNPARDMTVVSFTSENNNTLTMEVYDMSGRRINQLFHGNVVAGQTVNVDVNVNKFEDGIYTIRLFSSSNAKVERLMVTK